MIDSLKYAMELEEAGVPRAQAEVQAQALTEVIRQKLKDQREHSVIDSASKADFAICRDEVAQLRLDVESLKQQVNFLKSLLTAKIDLSR